MQIKRSELLNLCIECLDKGYERFKSDTTNGKSIQEVLITRAKEDITRQEMVELFKALPELKALKSKKRVINIIDDYDLTASAPTVEDTARKVDSPCTSASEVEDSEEDVVMATDFEEPDAEEEEDFFNH